MRRATRYRPGSPFWCANRRLPRRHRLAAPSFSGTAPGATPRTGPVLSPTTASAGRRLPLGLCTQHRRMRFPTRTPWPGALVAARHR